MTESTRIEKQKTIDILQTLVAVDTTQPLGNELKLVKIILQMLPKDITHEIINHDKVRASLIVRLKGESSEGGMAFLGHLDTVACGNVDEWVHDPFSGTIDNGKIYGRGTADMKGGVAAMIAVIMYLLDNNIKLTKDTYFCFTADEEANGMGAIALSNHPSLSKVSEIVICEPSNLKIGIAEKGALWLNIFSKGKLAHGSRPEIGINAIEKIIEFGIRIRMIIDDDIVHPLLGKNTISITALEGGIMTNVIPETATMNMDIRLLPSLDIDEALNSIEQLAALMIEETPGLDIKIEVTNSRPAVETKEDDPFVQRFKDACISEGIQTGLSGLFFYTDAAQIIPKINKPFIIFGPGDDEMAHVKNEHIKLDAVEQVSNVYLKYLLDNFQKGE